jgi:hypothetical protein
LHEKYAEPVDRESAREMLAARLEEGARKQAEEQAREQTKPAKKPAKKPAPKNDSTLLEDVVGSSAFKEFARTAAREIARGLFKTGRR